MSDKTEALDFQGAIEKNWTVAPVGVEDSVPEFRVTKANYSFTGPAACPYAGVLRCVAGSARG